jgi:hypothetical protein
MKTSESVSAFAGNTRTAHAFFIGREKEALMRKLALGVVAAATLLTAAVPAMAQIGFYAGPGGFGVGVGGPYWGHPYGGYYDYYGAPRAYVAPAWRYRHWHHWRHW